MRLWGRSTPPERHHWESHRSVGKGNEIAQWFLLRRDFTVCVLEHHRKGESRFLMGVSDDEYGETQWLDFPTLRSALTAGEKFAEILEANGFIGYRKGDAEVRNPRSEP